MGNSAYISFNRAVSDEKFTHMLKTVIDDHYSDWYQVEYTSWPDNTFSSCWVIKPKQGVITEADGYRKEQIEDGAALSDWSFYVRRAVNFTKKCNGEHPFYKGKFAHQVKVGGDWGYWFTDQIHGHLSKRFNATSSNGGVAGTWKIDPDVCPTYAHWLEKHIYKQWPDLIESTVKTLPNSLRYLKG